MTIIRSTMKLSFSCVWLILTSPYLAANFDAVLQDEQVSSTVKSELQLIASRYTDYYGGDSTDSGFSGFLTEEMARRIDNESPSSALLEAMLSAGANLHEMPLPLALKVLEVTGRNQDDYRKTRLEHDKIVFLSTLAKTEDEFKAKLFQDSLVQAVYEQDKSLTKWLLNWTQNYQDISEEDRNQALNNALFASIEESSIELTKILLQAGAKFNPNEQGDTVLDVAIDRDDLPSLQLLVKHGTPLDIVDTAGLNLLQKSIIGQRFKIASWLLEQGAPANIQGTIKEGIDYEAWSAPQKPDYPLFLLLNNWPAEAQPAEQKTRIKLLDQLLSKTSQLDILDQEGNSLLFVAFESKNEDLLDHLLNTLSSDTKTVGSGDSFNVNFKDSYTDSYGNSFLHKLIKEKRFTQALSFAKQLDITNTNQTKADRFGYTPAQTLLYLGFPENADSGVFNTDAAKLLALLVQNPAQVAYLDISGNTLLHLAYKREYQGLSDWLPQIKNIDAINSQGQSLLHSAVLNGDESLSKLLVQQGAEVDLVDSHGETPVSLAISKNHGDLATLLLKNSKFKYSLKNGDSLLHRAASVGNDKLISQLLQAGLNPVQKNQDGYFPVHLAISNGFLASAKQLMSVYPVPATGTEATSAENTDFTDSRIVYWSSLYWAGMRTELLNHLEQDLLSQNPHVLAPYVWVSMHDAHDQLESALITAKTKIRAQVQRLAEIKQLDDAGKYQELFKRFPPELDYSASEIFGLSDLAYAAKYVAKFELSYRYWQKAILLKPDSWQALWGFQSEELLNAPVIREQAKSIAMHPKLVGTLASVILKEASNAREWGAPSSLKWTQTWLEHFPNDVRALTDRAFDLRNIKQFEEALRLSQKADLLFPFYGNRDLTPEILVRLGKTERAKRLTEVVAARFDYDQSPFPTKSVGATYYGEALRKAGDLGEARRVLETAVKKWPNVARLQKELGLLERRDKRYSQAAEYFEKLVALKSKPSNSDYVSLIDIYVKNKQYSKVISLTQQLLAKPRFYSQAIYLDMLEGAVKLENESLVEKIMSHARAHAGVDADLQVALYEYWWQQGKHQDVLTGLSQLANLRPGYSKALKAWLNKLEVDQGQAAAITALNDYVEEFPWSTSAWKLLIELTTPADKGMAVWQKANELNSTDAFACSQISSIYISQRRYKLAQDILNECKPALAQSNIESRQRFYLEQLWLLEQKSKRTGLTTDELTLARNTLRDYKQSYAALNNAYRYEVSIELAEGNKEKALKALEKRAGVNPDSPSIYHSFAADFGETNNGYGYRMLERQPLNQGTLNSYLHKQVLWGGSPINALRAIDRAKKLGVYYNENWQRRALSQLGDPLTSFERYWTGGEVPGTSQRYLNWFDSARESALEGGRKQVVYNFDQNQAMVKIIAEDGEVYERNDHPVFSKFKSLRKGAAFIAFDYNEEGELVKAHNSTGESIKLTYNLDGQISSMKDLKGRVLRFNYDKALGKPNFIMMQGIGMIHVEYNAKGDIEKVSSEAGHKMALQVTQAFQNLLSLVKHSANERYLDRLFAKTIDEKLLELEQQFAKSREGLPKYTAKLELASYLVSQVQANKNYIDRADNALYEIFAELSYAENSELKGLAVEAVSKWYELFLTVRPYGLSASDYSRWRAMRSWLNEVAYLNDQFKTEDQRIAKNDLQLLKQGRWLNRHDINVAGFWQRHGVSGLSSDNKASQQSNAVLIRTNGDIVVGTNKGFSVFKEGFWQNYRLDNRFGKFSMSAENGEHKAEGTILSLAETEDSVLWLGTANGLFVLKGGYDSVPQLWQTASQGLPSPRINALSANQGQLLVSTAKGLAKVENGGDRIASLPDVANDIRQAYLLQNGDVIYRQSETILLRATNGATKKIADKVSMMTVDSQSHYVYWLSGQRFYRLPINDFSNAENVTPSFLGSSSDLLINKSVLALSMTHLDGYGELFTVSTDRGLNFYRGNYFESMTLPLEHLRAGLQLGANALYSRGTDIALATTEAVYSFKPSLAIQEKVGKVYDSLVDPEQGITYIATGTEIQYVDHKQPEQGARYFHSANAKKLRLDQDGNLITHDGLRVLRIMRGSAEAEQLFSAQQSTEDSKWRGSLSDIYIDSSNTIWVAAGSSVFRFTNEMKQPEEFNYFIDAAKFPAYSDMIHSIYQGLDGKIRAVASNEAHRKYKGVKLSGGVLEWDGKVFENQDAKANWFVTGYTVIDEHTAIVSTNTHFAREHKGQRESFKAMDDLSYNALTTNHPMIWLGGQGAKMPKSKTWLFPSAGGVVAYRQGQWFYPDRINQLLIDDQSLGRYGARTVHTVSVDDNNQIYIGTDRGLLIYKSQGVESLLNDNQLGQFVFQDKDGNQQRELRDIFLNKVDPNSRAGQLLSRYQQLEEELAKLADDQARGTGATTEGKQSEKGSADTSANLANKEGFTEKLRKRERKRQRLLARLEKEHFGLYQMLKLDPREIAAFHKKLAPHQALVQYLPTPEKLLIQVVTQQGAIIKEVSVSEAEIKANSLAAASILRAQAKRITADGQLALRGLVDKNNPLNTITADSHVAPLKWLYHYLLRPVEAELAGKEQVFITPVSSLTYVPFSALIRSTDGKPKYAVDRYNIGILPSMYHFNLVMQQDKSFSEKGLLIADPDGSLPGARVEVQRIADQLDVDKTVLIGDQADLQSIKAEVSDSRVVHFATHGVLNTEEPADSYLLLAGKYQLNVIDIAELNLEQTDLVVLSACESGIGGSGLEYATIARAFAHASVPSVIASYWQVSDAATQELMSGLYPQFEQHPNNNFAALAAAKRALISSNSALAHPAAWSGFEVFGKP